MMARRHHRCRGRWCLGEEDGAGGHREVPIIPWRTYDGGEDARGLMDTSSSGIDGDEPMTQNGDHDEDKNIHNGPSLSLLSHVDHISMASKVAPVWFLSNYFYAQSLQWTSIASSTVLASMGSIFAFGFATCSRFGDERVTVSKMIGVTLCFAGGVATALSDLDANDVDGAVGGTEDTPHRHLRYPRRLADLVRDPSALSLLGDLAGLVSAVGYGAYTVLLRHLCPRDEDRMSMQLLFGYIGILNMVALLPVAIWTVFSSAAGGGTHDSADDVQHATTTTTLTWSIFLFLLLKGILDNVLSDYLWARAVILTSATVASVGVGLTIPMAFLADWIMGNTDSSQGGYSRLTEVMGAVSVLFGFVFVNLNGDKENVGDGEDDFEDDMSRIDIVSVGNHDDDIIS
mmetsp:Transcript_14543/g.35047  ORF Transcript_14543/g.35047 Transcript_14543/m.35047 type:complete len:401 (-) Transcript_14543:83-1285(-)